MISQQGRRRSAPHPSLRADPDPVSLRAPFTKSAQFPFLFSGCPPTPWRRPLPGVGLPAFGHDGEGGRPYLMARVSSRAWARRTWGSGPLVISGPGSPPVFAPDPSRWGRTDIKAGAWPTRALIGAWGGARSSIGAGHGGRDQGGRMLSLLLSVPPLSTRRPIVFLMIRLSRSRGGRVCARFPRCMIRGAGAQRFLPIHPSLSRVGWRRISHCGHPALRRFKSAKGVPPTSAGVQAGDASPSVNRPDLFARNAALSSRRHRRS